MDGIDAEKSGSTETGLATSVLTVESLMITGVITVNPDDTVGRARELMLGLRIHGLPVIDRLGVVVGFVTSSDLVEEWPFGEPIEAVMSSPVHTVEVDAPVAEAAQRMLDERIHHLVVTRKRRPVGLVSSFDLLAIIANRTL